MVDVYSLHNLSFSGFTLSVEERAVLETAMAERRLAEGLERIGFWGKIFAEEADYLVVCGTPLSAEYPHKKFYAWCVRPRARHPHDRERNQVLVGARTRAALRRRRGARPNGTAASNGSRASSTRPRGERPAAEGATGRGRRVLVARWRVMFIGPARGVGGKEKSAEGERRGRARRLNGSHHPVSRLPRGADAPQRACLLLFVSVRIHACVCVSVLVLAARAGAWTCRRSRT